MRFALLLWPRQPQPRLSRPQPSRLHLPAKPAPNPARRRGAISVNLRPAAPTRSSVPAALLACCVCP